MPVAPTVLKVDDKGMPIVPPPAAPGAAPPEAPKEEKKSAALDAGFCADALLRAAV